MATIRDKMGHLILTRCIRMVYGESVVWLGRFSIEIEGVVSEAVDVLCEVRADGDDGVLGDRFAPLLQVPNEPDQRAEIMKDQAVDHKMVVLDRLALLVTTVFSDDSFTAEESPLQKAVQCLAFVGRALGKCVSIRAQLIVSPKRESICGVVATSSRKPPLA